MKWYVYPYFHLRNLAESDFIQVYHNFTASIIQVLFKFTASFVQAYCKFIQVLFSFTFKDILMELNNVCLWNEYIESRCFYFWRFLEKSRYLFSPYVIEISSSFFCQNYTLFVVSKLLKNKVIFLTKTERF
jgi:hypothetical protein